MTNPILNYVPYKDLKEKLTTHGTQVNKTFYRNFTIVCIATIGAIGALAFLSGAVAVCVAIALGLIATIFASRAYKQSGIIRTIETIKNEFPNEFASEELVLISRIKDVTNPALFYIKTKKGPKSLKELSNQATCCPSRSGLEGIQKAIVSLSENTNK